MYTVAGFQSRNIFNPWTWWSTPNGVIGSSELFNTAIDLMFVLKSTEYTRKNYELLKTGLNNVVLPILLIVVNNIEQVVEPESSPQSGVTMLNNIVDIIEQCGQHNIVQSCFQQPVTTYNFWLCSLSLNTNLCPIPYLRSILKLKQNVSK